MGYGTTKSVAGKALPQSPERDRRIARWAAVSVFGAALLTGLLSYWGVGLYGAVGVGATTFAFGMLGVYIFKKTAPHL